MIGHMHRIAAVATWYTVITLVYVLLYLINVRREVHYVSTGGLEFSHEDYRVCYNISCQIFYPLHMADVHLIRTDWWKHRLN